MKPRVCFVVPSLGIGGTERQLLYLLKGLQDNFEIMVICTRTDGAWVGDVRRMGRVKVLGLRGGWDLRMKSRLIKMFRTYRPDVVHSFMFGFDHAVNVAARYAGVSVIISSRRQRATWKKPRHIRLQKKANKLVDAIVANSRVVAVHAAKQEGRDIDDYHVIPNGIDVEKFRSRLDAKTIKQRYHIPVEKKVVGIVANFSPVKDHELFVETARELLSRDSDLHFVMAGKGPGVESIGALLQKYSMTDFVTGLTTISELQDVYRLMDVLVLTSKSEGFPNVVMEAMASHTPVVAANVGGVPELITDGETGTLIDNRDPKRFADAIERNLTDTEFVDAVTTVAFAFVRDNLSLEAMVSGYSELYDTLIRDKVKG